MINTLGISGNAHVVNVGGNLITHINDALGADTYAVLESIEERMKVVHNKDLGASTSVCLISPS